MSCHVLWKWETAAVSLYFIPATLNRMTICRVQSSKTQNLYHSCKPRCNLNVKIQVWTCKKQERRSATATSTILEKNLQFEVCRSAVALWATASQNVEAPMPASTIQQLAWTCLSCLHCPVLQTRRARHIPRIRQLRRRGGHQCQEGHLARGAWGVTVDQELTPFITPFIPSACNCWNNSNISDL